MIRWQTIVIACLIILVGLYSHGYAQPGEDHGHTPPIVVDDPLLDALNRRKPKLFKGYGHHTVAFKQICQGLYLDGYGEKFYYLLEPLSVKDKSCEACRPLLRAILAPCTPVDSEAKKKAKNRIRGRTTADKKKEAEAEPTPTPIPTPKVVLQRDLHPYVTDGICKAFCKVAKDKQINKATLPALKKISEVLRDPKDKSKVELEYFNHFMDLVEQPFEVLMAEQADTPGSHEKKKEELSELF